MKGRGGEEGAELGAGLLWAWPGTLRRPSCAAAGETAFVDPHGFRRRGGATQRQLRPSAPRKTHPFRCSQTQPNTPPRAWLLLGGVASFAAVRFQAGTILSMPHLAVP